MQDHTRDLAPQKPRHRNWRRELGGKDDDGNTLEWRVDARTARMEMAALLASAPRTMAYEGINCATGVGSVLLLLK